MHNYYTNLIWKIDIALLCAVFFLVLFIVVYAALRYRAINKRQARLINIKKHLYKLLLPSVKKDIKINTIPEITTRDFLDVEINRLREAVFFNDAEQKILKKHYIESKNLHKLENIARNSKNKWRRIESIIGLGYSMQSSALNTLEKALYDRDKDIAYFSIIALGQIKTPQSARILLNFLKENAFNAYRIVSVLEDFPPEISSEVILLANNPNPRVRISGIKLIAKFKQEDYVEKIEDLSINDESGEVRAEACEYLGSLGKEKYIDAISKCLKDSLWLVRIKAIEALSKILGPKCIPNIIDLIRDNSWSVIESVKSVLTEHIEAALPYIEKFLYTGDSIAKQVSIEALESAGYISNILSDILFQKDSKKKHAIYLLKGIVKAKIHFGLESALENLDSASRNIILEIVSQEDKALTEHVKKKMNEEIGNK